MKTLFEELKNSYICRKKRSQMIKTYLSGRYFQFDSDNHVIADLDKKVKTTTNKGTKIILLTLLGLVSLVILILGRKRSSKEIEKE